MTVIGGSGHEPKSNVDSINSFQTDESLKDVDPFGDGKQTFIAESTSDFQSDQSAEERD